MIRRISSMMKLVCNWLHPEEALELVLSTGFKEAKTISTKDMEQYYFANGLLPASGEVFLLATT